MQPLLAKISSFRMRLFIRSKQTESLDNCLKIFRQHPYSLHEPPGHMKPGWCCHPSLSTNGVTYGSTGRLASPPKPTLTPERCSFSSAAAERLSSATQPSSQRRLQNLFPIPMGSMAKIG